MLSKDPLSVSVGCESLQKPQQLNQERNKSFTCKVQNINKISEQISSLLKYVQKNTSNQPNKENYGFVKGNLMSVESWTDCSVKNDNIIDSRNEKGIEESFVVGPTSDARVNGLSKLDQICFANNRRGQQIPRDRPSLSPHIRKNSYKYSFPIENGESDCMTLESREREERQQMGSFTK